MPSGPNSSKAKVRPGHSASAYSIRSSLASKSGPEASFHVLVRWNVTPRQQAAQGLAADAYRASGVALQMVGEFAD